MKQLHLRIDSVDTHARMTLFVNGANAGQLTMRTLEAAQFARILRAGCNESIVSKNPLQTTNEHLLYP